MSIHQIDTGTDELLCRVDERVATITLNRQRNGMRCQTTLLRRCVKRCWI